MTKLVLDVDTGTDDAVAIMLAALHPDLELLGVTTVQGNVAVELCTENSLRVLDHIGRSDVGVYQGAARPLIRPGHPAPRTGLSRGVHGDYLELAPARSTVRASAAVEYLVETFMHAGGDVVLVPTGPLTNVATALLAKPELSRRIRRVVLMGGGDRVANATSSAEFNIWADPEAARIVLRSGIEEIVVVPLDSTHEALVSSEDCQALRRLGNPAGAAAASMIETRIAGYEASSPIGEGRAAPVHDAVCVAYLLAPEILSLEAVHVDVETSGELTTGRTVVDRRSHADHAPNVSWSFHADRERFVEILLQGLAGTPSAHS
jgi:inosine-uridine nucleoside N-ribohydrolase